MQLLVLRGVDKFVDVTVDGKVKLYMSEFPCYQPSLLWTPFG